MKDQIQPLITLCNKMLRKRNLSIEAEWVFCLFLQFFMNHRILISGYMVGKFEEVGKKLIDDFLLREENREDLGFNPIPILSRDKDGKEVFEALDILKKGYERATRDARIFYYTLSLKVPEKSLYRFATETRYIVVDTKDQARKLMVLSREKVERERNMILEGPKTDEEKIIYQELTSSQSPPVRHDNPFRSNGFGTLQGEREPRRSLVDGRKY